MNEQEIIELAAKVHKFYDMYKDKLSVSERHGLMKLYLTLDFSTICEENIENS
ncbi:MAG: hypothetical protein WC516_09105 [Patescibacteria group bacterium]|jgi:hypothetical protein